jgi:hypothetical protein
MKARALVIACTFAVAALGHGPKGVHLKGTVKAVAAQTLTVDTADRGAVDVGLDPKTRFDRSGKAISKDALVVGERVVVHAQPAGDGLRAELVKVAKPTVVDGGTP